VAISISGSYYDPYEIDQGEFDPSRTRPAGKKARTATSYQQYDKNDGAVQYSYKFKSGQSMPNLDLDSTSHTTSFLYIHHVPKSLARRLDNPLIKPYKPRPVQRSSTVSDTPQIAPSSTAIPTRALEGEHLSDVTINNTAGVHWFSGH